MSTTLKTQGEVNVLTVDGELVAATVGEFSRLVEQCRKRDGRDFVVDLEHATALDSAGLEALTALKRECDECLGLVKLCGLDNTLRKILEMTRLDRSFDVRADVKQALAVLD